MEAVDEIRARAEAGGWLNAVDAADLLDISVATFYNRVNEKLVGWRPKTAGSRHKVYSPVDVLKLWADGQVERSGGAPEA